MLPGQIPAECHPKMSFQAGDLVVKAPPGDLIIGLGIGFHERRQPPPQDDRSGGTRLQAIKDLAGAWGRRSAQLPLPGAAHVIKIPRSDEQLAAAGRSGGDGSSRHCEKEAVFRPKPNLPRSWVSRWPCGSQLPIRMARRRPSSVIPRPSSATATQDSLPAQWTGTSTLTGREPTRAAMLLSTRSATAESRL